MALRLISENEFEEKDQMLQDITRGLMMESGSLARMCVEDIEFWLRGKLDDKARERVKESSETSYSQDYSDERVYHTVERAIENANLEGNSALNNIAAMHVVEKLIAMNRIRPFEEVFKEKKKPVRIADVGAGKGATTLAVWNRIRMNEEARKLIPFCKFYLIDPSDEVVDHARREAKSHGLGLKKTKNYKIEEDTFRNVFGEKEDAFFDMVYSTAVCHHFSDESYLLLMHQKLADEGILIMADWFTSVWGHPAYVEPILSEFGASTHKINRFHSIFNVGNANYQDLLDKLPDEDRRANEEMLNFVIALGREMDKLDRRLRIPFLEAHEPMERRVEKMGNNRLVTDLKELQAKHTAFVNQQQNIVRVFPSTTIAQIILAANVKGNRIHKQSV